MAILGYKIDVSDTSGILQATLTNPLSLQIDHELNWFDSHTIALPRYDSAIYDLFAKDAIVEVYRLLDDVWYYEYGGFHRTPQRTLQANDEQVFWSYGRGFTDLLHRREIMYPADRASAYTLKGGPAESVLKSFVIENATAAAVSPPRRRAGAFTGLTLTVAADAGLGPNWFGQRSNKNLLEVLQEIATASGVDFGIRRIPGTLQFEFYTGYPQLGDDLTDLVQFNPLAGNMVTPSYTFSATEEANVVMVLGQGQGTARRWELLKSGAENDSPWNDIEVSVDARGESNYAGLHQSGLDALAERAAKESFTFDVLQTHVLQYGRDYAVGGQMGDLVTGVFDDIVRTKKIVGAHLTNGESGDEQVRLSFGDLPARPAGTQ